MTRSSPDAVIKRPSLGRRASRSLARMLIVFCIGVSTTLAWQSYGEAARATGQMFSTLCPGLPVCPEMKSCFPKTCRMLSTAIHLKAGSQARQRSPAAREGKARHVHAMDQSSSWMKEGQVKKLNPILLRVRPYFAFVQDPRRFA
jgi:hypothetical protein